MAMAAANPGAKLYPANRICQEPTGRIDANANTAAQATPGSYTVFVRLYTFVPHFLAPLFLAEQRLPKTMVQLIVQVLVQHDLLLEYKSLVDWLKVVIAKENVTHFLGANPDPVPLAMDKVLMDHRMVLHKNDLPGC